MKFSYKQGDWQVFCHICGLPCWGSHSTRLGKYTGAEGAIVCPNDRDKINYGFVPYKIRPERPVPYVSDAISTGQAFNDVIAPFDLDTYYPTEISNPNEWRLLTENNWEDETRNWEDIG